MSKVAQAKAALEAAQEDLAKALKEEKGAVVPQIRDDIVSMKITKGDLRGAPMKQLLGKDFEKVYPQSKSKVTNFVSKQLHLITFQTVSTSIFAVLSLHYLQSTYKLLSESYVFNDLHHWNY